VKKRKHPVLVQHPRSKCYVTYNTETKEYLFQDGTTGAVVFEHHIAVEFLKSTRSKGLMLIDVDELQEKSPKS
jgi:hypothetical protein